MTTTDQLSNYELGALEATPTGFRAQLALQGAPQNRYGQDVKELVLEVEYQTTDRLHVHIYDAAGQQYQISDKVLPRPGPESHAKDVLNFNHQESPFAFWVTRDDEVLFDTRGQGLTFSDQYLQLTTAVPANANIYGLGEVVSSKGFRRDPNDTLITLWSSDSAGTPMDKNIYGSHPVYLEVREGCATHGIFLRNSHGMDILLRPGTIEYRVLGGTLDLYFMAGPTPIKVVEQYSEVVGRPAQVPFWSLGFHLCRYGYWTVEGTKEVVDKMRAAGIPLETIWNDLEYMDRKRNFVVSPKDFPHDKFRAFLDWLHENNQHWIPILDAGIPKVDDVDDYPLYAAGRDLDVFIKQENGEEFVGQVWPGATVFPDWTSKNIQKWWQMSFDSLKKIAPYDGIWIDMNEPASFSSGFDGKVRPDEMTGPQKSLAKEVKHKLDDPPYAIHDFWTALDKHTVPPSAVLADGSRVYSSHNTYGYEQTILTRKVLLKQNPGIRPFIVSRSTFAGHGAHGAHWLGDNYSTFAYMKASIQGVLDFQIFQVPMVGPDTGGFAKNCTEELLNRWMMLSAFFPFYRNHNDMGASSQEPYLWESTTAASRKYINMRYRLLPYWETLMAQAHRRGTPVVRPLFFEFPDPTLLGIDTQFLLGPALLVTPVLDEGATTVTGHFPGTWRDWLSHEVVSGKTTLKAPLGYMPVHMRAGTIVLTHTKASYTLTETRKSPYTLYVHLEKGQASGEAILDDGMSLDSATTFVSFHASGGKLEITATGDYHSAPELESVVLLGLDAKPSGSAGTWRDDALHLDGLTISLHASSTVLSW